MKLTLTTLALAAGFVGFSATTNACESSCNGQKKMATLASSSCSSQNATLASSECGGQKMKTMSTLASSSCSGQKMSTLASSECGVKKDQPMASLAAMGGNDIVDTAVSAGSFNTLAAALKAADLVNALKSDGPFTVFAPTDEAFAKLPKGTLETLLKPENKAVLTAILTYHVVPGNVTAGDVVNMTSAKSLNGQRIVIGLDGGVQVDSANVVKTDIICSNGIIHVIDSVILPSTDNIVETAVKAGSFNTLTAAVKAAGLAEALSGKGPVTVFAPTDAAFAALPAGTVETLLKPENRSKLQAILKYHVVPGRVYAADALSAQTAETAQGSRVRFSLQGGALQVNDANIINADIDTSNGVIHVIDRVILPG